MKSILIIGGGNMGGALAVRWRNQFKAATISVVDPSAVKRKMLAAHGMKTYASLEAFSGKPDMVVLAIKPQMAVDILKALCAKKLRPQLLISIMAGVPLSRLKGVATHIARVMPNTPAMIGEGISAICAPQLPAALKQSVEALFRTVGPVVWIDYESDMHAVTAISGSGPAYLFAFMESFMRAGESVGLNKDLSRALVTQTIKGAALLAAAKDGDVVSLRKQVTSPKGTTEAALKILQKAGLNRMLKKTVKAAKKRSKQLNK